MHFSYFKKMALEIQNKIILISVWLDIKKQHISYKQFRFRFSSRDTRTVSLSKSCLRLLIKLIKCGISKHNYEQPNKGLARRVFTLVSNRRLIILPELVTNNITICVGRITLFNCCLPNLISK